MKNRTLAILALVFAAIATVSVVIFSWLHFSVSDPYGPLEICNKSLAASIDYLMSMSKTWLPLPGLILGIFALILTGNKDNIAKQLAGLAVIISILLFLAAFFGIFNQPNYLPDRCEMQQGFYCKDFKVVDMPENGIDLIKFTFQNGITKGIWSYTNGTMTYVNLSTGANIMIVRVTSQGSGDLSRVVCDTGNELMASASGKPRLAVVLGQTIDISVPCGAGTLDKLLGSGKKKFYLNITWYAINDEPTLNHTMTGELLAPVTRCP
jgi:hypothetical protein